MPWHQCFLLFLVFSAVDSKQVRLPAVIKNVAVRSVIMNFATVEWTSFEVDVVSFKIQVQNSDGTSYNKTVEANRPDSYIFCFVPPCATLFLPSSFYDKIVFLTINETNTIRVMAINRQGEGPPSPDINYFNGPAQWGHIFISDSRPKAPKHVHVESSSGNRVKVIWDEVNNWKLQGPCEYTIHFGNTQNVSTWNTLKTNNTWIVLENNRNGTYSSAYVTASDGNKTSPNSQVIAISGYDDMTGLPEPVITIEPANKKGTFSPGDWMLFKCSLPPNTNMRDLVIELTVGPHVVRKQREIDTWITFYTLADESVNTATCVVTHTETSGTRKGRLSWNVHQIMNDEYLKRRKQEIEQDRERLVSNNI